MMFRRQVLEVAAAVVAAPLAGCESAGAAQNAQNEQAARLMTAETVAAPDPSNVIMDTYAVQGATNLLVHGNWRHMHGTEQVAGTLQLTPLNMQIEQRDSTTYGPYSIINQFGSRLQVGGSGNFSLDTTITTEPGGACRYELFGRPPLIYDDGQWTREKVSLHLQGNNVVIEVWDGQNQAPATTTTLAAPHAVSGQRLRITRTNGKLTVSSGATTLGTVDERGVFTSGEVWFGFAAEGAAAKVGQLTVTPAADCHMSMVDTSTVRVRRQNPMGLNVQARKYTRNTRVGAAVATPLAFDLEYADLMLSGQIGVGTLENATKPGYLQPQEGHWTFGEADAMYAILARAGIKGHLHTLVFARSLPQWMRALPYATSAQKARGRDVMRAHITGAMSHFANTVESCDVVNEVLNDPGPNGDQLRQHLWWQFYDDPAAGLRGEDYIADAFRTAHRAAPNVKLIINENGLEAPGTPRWKFFFSMVKKLVGQGVPMHGVGLQSHIYELPRDAELPSSVESHAKAFQDLGLDVRISELDVTGQLGSIAQALQYGAVALAAAKRGLDLAIWGLTDRYGSTTDRSGNTLRYDDNLPWTAGEPMRAKLSVPAILAAFRGTDLLTAAQHLRAGTASS